MASRELYSSISKPKKKIGLGQYLGDYGRLMGDTLLSTIGASDVISDDMYKTDLGRGASEVLSPLAQAAGGIGLSALTGRLVGPKKFGGGGDRMKLSNKKVVEYADMGVVPWDVNLLDYKRIKKINPKAYKYSDMPKEIRKDRLNKIPSNIINALTHYSGEMQENLIQQATNEADSLYKYKNYAQGGLRTFEGNTHEQGGIQLGQDEVEGGETMFNLDTQSDFIFSDRIKYPGTNQTFATKSKRISKKYSLRPNDPYDKKVEEMELKKLAEVQEAVKLHDSVIVSEANHMADGGIHIKKANRGKFTESASRAGMKIQEFARHILANKEDYSSTQVKRANFARNASKWHSNGGIMYGGGGEWDVPTYEDYLINLGANTSTEFDKPESILSTGYRQGNSAMPITKKTPKGLPEVKTLNNIQDSLLTNDHKSIAPQVDSSYQSNFTLPALGYAAQALTNIPALFTKPETINSSRVKFDRINLAEQRNEARRSRNLGLATARGVGATDAGQMMNYLSGTTAGLNSAYSNRFNQSLLAEQQANIETNMREQLANSEIERYDEQINAQERDAARALRMNALQNIGSIAAGAGKDYMAMQESDAMMNVLMGSNRDYTYDVNTPTGRMKWLKSKTLTPKRRK